MDYIICGRFKFHNLYRYFLIGIGLIFMLRPDLALATNYFYPGGPEPPAATAPSLYRLAAGDNFTITSGTLNNPANAGYTVLLNGDGSGGNTLTINPVTEIAAGGSGTCVSDQTENDAHPHTINVNGALSSSSGAGTAMAMNGGFYNINITGTVSGTMNNIAGSIKIDGDGTTTGLFNQINCLTSINTATIQIGSLSSGGDYFFLGGIDNPTAIQLQGNNTFNTNSQSLTNMNGTGSGLVISASSTATLAGVVSGSNVNSNTSGTVHVTATLSLGAFTVNPGGLLTFDSSPLNNTPITNNGTVQINGVTQNNAIITNNNLMTISAQLYNTGSVANSAGKTLTLASGANVQQTIANAGFISVTGPTTISRAVSGAGTITNTNSGTLTFNTGANVIANSITNTSGTIDIAGSSVFNNTLTTNNATFTVTTGTLSGSGGFTNNSSATLGSGGVFSLTGAFSNGATGVFNLNHAFSTTGFASASNVASGKISINNVTFTTNGSFTNGGSLYVNQASGTISGPLSGTGSLIVGSDATLTPYSTTNYTTNNTISMPTINVNAGTFTINNAISGVTSAFVIANGNSATATIAAGIGGTGGNFTNNGTVNFNSGGAISTTGTFMNTSTGMFSINATFSMASFSSSANAGTMAVNTNGTLTIPSGFANNIGATVGTISTAAGGTPGVLNVSNPLSGLVTNAGTTNVTALFTPASTSSNSGTISVTSGGTFTTPTTPSTFSNTGTVSTAGTGIFNVNCAIAGILSNAGTTNVATAYTPATSSSNSGTLQINAGGGIFTVPASFTSSSGTITTASGGTPAVLNVSNPLSGIVTNAGTTNVTAAFTPASTSTNSGTMNISGSGSFTQPTPTYTYSGTINVNTGTSPFGGAITGDNNVSILNIGNANSVNFTTSNTITNVANINVGNASFTGTQFTTSGANSITGVKTSFTVASGATATLGATLSGTASGTNSGTMTVSGTFGLSGGFTNSNMLTFSPGANNSTNVTNNATFMISGPGTIMNSATLTNNATMTVLNATLSTGTIVNNYGGTLTFDGTTNADNVNNAGTFNVTNVTSHLNSSNTATITNAGADASHLATMNVSCGLTGGGTIVNNAFGTINLNSGANVANAITNNAGATLKVNANITAGVVTGSGSVNVDTTGVLNATSYTNTGIHFVNIGSANPTDVGQVISSGAVDVHGANIDVTAFSATSGSWTIMTGTSVNHAGTTFTFPSTSAMLTTWAPTFTSTQIIVGLVAKPFYPIAVSGGAGQFALDVAAALDAIAQNSPSAAQTSLLMDFQMSTSVANLIYNLNQMVPNISVNTANIIIQNTLMSKVEVRAAALREGNNNVGIASGEICNNTALWIGSFGNIAKQRQNAEGLNTGYRIRSLGGIIGIDTKFADGSVFGVALASSNANIYEMSNFDFSTQSKGYYGLMYGSNYYGNFFTEYVLAAGTNNNSGVRGIVIGNSNLAVNSNYKNWQGGVKFNFGNFSDWLETVRFSHVVSLQYSYLHQPTYDETGSIAALNVQPVANQSVLTIGTGFRFALPGIDPWLTGSREVRVLATYDLVQPSQTTFANFVIGSPNFSITNASPARLGYQVGADFSLCFFDHWQLKLSYDFEGRSGYFDHVGEAQLKFIF